MPTKTTDGEATLEERVSGAQRRIDELEAELSSERERAAQLHRRLEVKEREIREIHRSRAWGLVSVLRSLKHRLVDPVLGAVGITWPRHPVEAPPRAATDEHATLEELRRRDDPAACDVVCLAASDWDFRVQRPQQLMSRFAAAGHRVFYVNPRFRSVGPAWEAVRKRRNVYEISLRGAALYPHAERLDTGSVTGLLEGLAAFRDTLSLERAITVVYLPFWWPLAREARARFDWPVLYDCMDDHAAFATVRQTMAAEEESMLAAADLVTVSSATLRERALSRRSAVLLLRNACDYEHFASTPPPANERPVIGYFGAIADWFDSSLVAGLAERRSDWDFLLVGSTFGGDIARLATLSNVTLTGEEAYESLPGWLARFDVGIVPFKRTRLTDATNPIKIYEMLAGGRPVVSAPIPEATTFLPHIRIAAGVDEFERAIEASLASDAGAVEARRAFARHNTWAARFHELRAAIAPLVTRVPS